MPNADELDELEAALDPAARYVVGLMRQSNDDLKRMLGERDKQLAFQSEQLTRLTEQLDEMKRMLFGKRSEKLPPMASEVRRVVEADELTVDGKPMPVAEEERKKEKRRKARKKSEPARKQQRALRKNLPVLKEAVVVAAEQLPEGYSLGDFRSIGDGEIIRRVEHVREHLVIVEYHLQSLASKDGRQIIKAEAPAQVTDGGHYGPSLYAHVVVAKCVDSLPLHRIAKMMRRAGCPIARSTLCSIFHRVAELLVPIYARLLHIARHAPYVHADETTLRVQAQGQCFKGWVWVVLCKQVIAYAFDESRSGAVAERLLGGTTGNLVIDGYSGYNAVTDAEGRKRVGCWSHARRKFFEALSSVPDAKEALDLILELYRIEYIAAERDILGTEAHGLLRDTQSRAALGKIYEWIDARQGRVPPKSKMGMAIGYADKQRDALSRFLDDPKLPLDNNIAERALRIIALGRKNFLFAGHVEGAKNLAVLQTIVATCAVHDVDPYAYIADVLIRVQTHPASRIDELLPWSWQPLPQLAQPGA